MSSVPTWDTSAPTTVSPVRHHLNCLGVFEPTDCNRSATHMTCSLTPCTAPFRFTRKQAASGKDSKFPPNWVPCQCHYSPLPRDLISIPCYPRRSSRTCWHTCCRHARSSHSSSIYSSSCPSIHSTTSIRTGSRNWTVLSRIRC